MKINKRVLIICICAMLIICGAFVVASVVYEHNNKQEIYINGIVAAKSEAELISDSDLIIRGQVKQIFKSKWSNEGFARGDNIRNILQTDIEVYVEEVLSGNVDTDTVTVRIDKGEEEETIVYSTIVHDFTEGENVLLFLSRDDGDVATDEDYYVVTGMNQGKYTANSVNTDKYVGVKGELTVSELKNRIKNEQ